MTAVVLRGDARRLPLADGTVDAVVTDPPYGLGFMGKEWDRPGSAARGYKSSDMLAVNPYGRARAEFSGASYSKDPLPVLREFQRWCEQWAAECLRVLKPGGHLLAFGGTRTWHRLACAIEDAGFEIRDSIHWIYGSGFPKSLDVSKAIDKQAGAQRAIVGPSPSSSPGRAPGVLGMGGANRRPGMEARMAAEGIESAASSSNSTPPTASWSGGGSANPYKPP